MVPVKFGFVIDSRLWEFIVKGETEMEEFTKEIGDALADVAGSALNMTGEVAVGAVEVAVEGLAEGLSFAGTMAGAFLSGASEVAVTSVAGTAVAVTEIFTIS